jgi:hypothetical protein
MAVPDKPQRDVAQKETAAKSTAINIKEAMFPVVVARNAENKVKA